MKILLILALLAVGAQTARGESASRVLGISQAELDGLLQKAAESERQAGHVPAPSFDLRKLDSMVARAGAFELSPENMEIAGIESADDFLARELEHYEGLVAAGEASAKRWRPCSAKWGHALNKMIFGFGQGLAWARANRKWLGPQVVEDIERTAEVVRASISTLRKNCGW